MIKDRVVLLGVAGLAAVATAGWMRQPIAVPAAPLANSFQPLPIEAPAATSVSAFTPVTQPIYVPQQRSAAVRPNNAVRVVRPDYDDTRVTRARRAVYEDGAVSTPRGRSKKASAAIVAGSAAAGAAVGGLAGGGKGAVIGALGGGAAGLVYDRMTHKKAEAKSDDYRYRSTSSNDEPIRQERSTLKRAAIIGGSAAAGAAIGGAAGGGKGAAIGALAGGAGGYIYDRMTKNR